MDQRERPSGVNSRAELRTYFMNRLAVRNDEGGLLGWGQYEGKLLNFFTPGQLEIWIHAGWIERMNILRENGSFSVIYLFVEENREEEAKEADQLRRVQNRVLKEHPPKDPSPDQREKLARRAERERLRLQKITPCRICGCTDEDGCVQYDDEIGSAVTCHWFSVGLCSFCEENGRTS